MTYSNYLWNVRDPERKIYKGFRFNIWLILKLYLWIPYICDKYVNFGDKVVSWKKIFKMWWVKSTFQCVTTYLRYNHKFVQLFVSVLGYMI